MDRTELEALAETARRFATREVTPSIGTEGRDGDLEGALPRVLGRAAAAGLLASPEPETDPGDLGVWGRPCSDAGPLPSVTVLEEVARACAGVAACLHFSGLAAREAEGEKGLLGPLALAIPVVGARRRGREAAPHDAPVLARTGAGFSLSGGVLSAHGAPGATTFLVVAAGPGGWVRVLVPREAPGLVARAVEPRCGLGALEVCELSLEAVSVEGAATLGPPGLAGLVAQLSLGLAAISIGNARGALEAARRYAGERHQGGCLIEEQDAVRLLLGEAASRIDGASAYLRAAASAPSAGEARLLRAQSVKLRAADDCCEAVTRCLQVLGGYGYMEDYRLEKRLRDALTLKAMAGRPDDIRLECARLEPGRWT